MTNTPKPAPLTAEELAGISTVQSKWAAAPAGEMTQEAHLLAFWFPRAIATIEALLDQLKKRDAEWTHAVVPWWSMTLTPDKAKEEVEQLHKREREQIRRLREALSESADCCQREHGKDAACYYCVNWRALLRETEAEHGK